MTNDQALEQLEHIIDRFGVSPAISMLAQVCSEKAEHLRTNWQDEQSAKAWDKNMMALDLVANKIRKMNLGLD